MEKKPIYIGIFLDASSRKKLLEVFPPIHPKVFADHITLAFGLKMIAEVESQMNLSRAEMGNVRGIEVVGMMEDDRGQAAMCSPFGLLLSSEQLEFPHITISCAEGTNPAYSKELRNKVEGKRSKVLSYNLYLTGILDYFPRTIG